MTEQELKQKALSRLPSVINKILLGQDPFPLQIPYKRPSRTGDPTEILKLKRFLKGQSKPVVGFGPTIHFEDTSTRRFGNGLVPGTITFDSLDDLTRYLGKKVEIERIIANAHVILSEFPAISGWVGSKTELLSTRDAMTWKSIVAVINYFVSNPKPWIYPRELPLNLHSKFLEEHYRIVINMLVQISPAALNASYSTWQDRLGLRSSSDMIEGRFLDPDLAGDLPAHMQTTTHEWNKCIRNSPRIALITENRTCLLTLPQIQGCLSLLGKGYAVTKLADLEKLHTSKVYYWGDVDQHGFEILASLRSKVSSVQSILMDEETFSECAALVSKENVRSTLSSDFIKAHLTEPEQRLWQKCAEFHYRLEQELIPYPLRDNAFKLYLA